jgi:hypothetical protein
MIGLTVETPHGLYRPVCARCPLALVPAGTRSAALLTLERHTVAVHA